MNDQTPEQNPVPESGGAADMPLSIAGLQDIVDEIAKRYTTVVLMADRPDLKSTEHNDMQFFFRGSNAAAIGLCEIGRARWLRQIQKANEEDQESA